MFVRHIIQWSNVFQMIQKDQWILSVKEYEKFIDMISESIFQPLRNYYLMTWDLVSLRKNIQSYLRRLLKYSSLFQLHICVKSVFLHIVKPRQHIVTDWIQIWLPSSLALEIWQNTKQWLFTNYFLFGKT